MSTDKMIDDVEIRQQIAEICNIEVDGEWDISSRDNANDLYSIHADKMDIKKYTDLRGVVVSLKHKAIIAKSHGFSPLVISNSLKCDEDGTLHLKDTDETEYHIPEKNYSLKYCLEGTVIRVMRFMGTTYFMTHRQLQYTRSRWIVTRTFKELYEELHGPTEEELFDLTKPYSPYCYYFLIHHPEVLNACRDDVFKGNLVYIGKSQYWTAEDLNIPAEEVSDYEWVNTGVSNIITAKTTGAIYDSQGSIPLDTANSYLNYGFIKPFDSSKTDPRVRTGESVIVRQVDDDGNFVRLIKVQSEAYYWRAMIKGDNPNLLNQFFKLATNSLFETYGVSYKKGEKVDNEVNYKKFRKMFPKLDKWSIEHVVSAINTRPLRLWPCIVDTNVENNDPNDPKDDYIWTMEDRLYNIWAAFLMVVPIHRQKEVATFYHRFLEETRLNAAWIRQIETVGLENFYAKDQLHKAVIRIINTARTDTKNTLLKANLPEKFKGFAALPTYQEILNKRINKLMSRERGFTRYGITLNRKLITAKNAAETKAIQDEIDSFVYVESDFPPLPGTRRNPILEDGFHRGDSVSLSDSMSGMSDSDSDADLAHASSESSEFGSSVETLGTESDSEANDVRGNLYSDNESETIETLGETTELME